MRTLVPLFLLIASCSAPVVVSDGPCEHVSPDPGQPSTDDVPVSESPSPAPVETPSIASPTVETPPAPVPDWYLSGDYVLVCGCGCCGDVDPLTLQPTCLYRDSGPSLEEMRKAEQVASSDPSCAVKGCQLPGDLYVYCD